MMDPIFLTLAAIWALTRTPEEGVITSTLAADQGRRYMVLAEPLPGDDVLIDPQDALAWGY